MLREQLKLDPKVDEVLKQGWPLVRVDITLRQILRASYYELLFRKDVPAKSIIVEYIDIAQAFFASGDEPKIV